jgi:hypothetical protein
VVRQDFACISSKAKNKELVLVADNSFGAKRIDDDTEEDAETEVEASAEQKSLFETTLTLLESRTLWKKPKYMNMNVDIIGAVMLDKECEAGIQVHQGGETNTCEEAKTRILKTNTKYNNVTIDIIDAIMLDKECEAGIQVHQGGEINMLEEPEMRMLKTTPMGKYNKNVNMDHVLDKKPEMTDIIDDVMPNREYKAGIQVHQAGKINMLEDAETRMLKTNLKGKNNVATPIEDPNTVQC